MFGIHPGPQQPTAARDPRCISTITVHNVLISLVIGIFNRIIDLFKKINKNQDALSVDIDLAFFDLEHKKIKGEKNSYKKLDIYCNSVFELPKDEIVDFHEANEKFKTSKNIKIIIEEKNKIKNFSVKLPSK